MKQILIATHGKLASGLRHTAEMIAGPSTEITTIDAYVDPADDLEAQLSAYFAAHAQDRIFVLTDLMEGSVNQRMLAYAEKENVTLITGTNLAVLVQIMLADETVSDQEVQEYLDGARQQLQWIRPAKAAAPASIPAEAPAPKPAGPAQDYSGSQAKVTALRIDDRLIHGQVAMTWTRQLKVQGILVANDAAAQDETQKMALKMAVPSGIKVLIEPVEDAIRVLNHPKAATMRILVLTRTIQDALRIRQQVGEIGFLNLGNAGRFDGIDLSEKTVVTPTVLLTAQENEAMRQLAELDPGFCLQQVPNDEKLPVRDLLARRGAGVHS